MLQKATQEYGEMNGNLLRERLDAKTVIFDGAMGTELYKRNFFVNVSYENLCLTAPGVIQEIHQAYKDAGAEVLTTNSYGANFNTLYRFGLGDKVREINEASVRIARKVAGRALLVAGSVGPLGKFPDGMEPSEEDAVKMLLDQIVPLEEAGADFLLFETVSSRNDLERILAAMRGRDAVPWAVSCLVDTGANLPDGTSAEEIFRMLKDAEGKPTAFGLNCGLGPDQMLEALEKIIGKSPFPVIVQPNSGQPKQIEGRMIQMCSPEYFMTYCMRYVTLGARGVGGCCGTDPDDIRDMCRSINPLTRIQANRSIFVKEPETPPRDPKPFAERSSFASKLAAKQWVRNVEIVPPQGYEMEKTLEKAKECRAAGFDAVNVPDGPRASSRFACGGSSARPSKWCG